jgi:GNAT superfamily N-acetyltransferase
MIEFHSVSDAYSLAAARALISAHIEAHSAAHNAETRGALLAALPAPYIPPAGGLWLAWDGPEAVGCVALQAQSTDVAEIKRMYVRPESRGRGVGRALAVRAIVEARALGYDRLRLGTLTTMHAAQSLYASLGFRPIAPYRAVEFGDTLFYELDLSAVEARA